LLACLGDSVAALTETLGNARKHKPRHCSAGYLIRMEDALLALSAYMECLGRLHEGGGEPVAAEAVRIARVLLMLHEAVVVMDRVGPARQKVIAAFAEIDAVARKHNARIRAAAARRAFDPRRKEPGLDETIEVSAFDGVDGLLLTSKYQEACALADVVRAVARVNHGEPPGEVARLLAVNLVYRVVFGCPRIRGATEWHGGPLRLSNPGLLREEVDGVARSVLLHLSADLPSRSRGLSDSRVHAIVRAALRALGVRDRIVANIFKRPTPKSEG
jgi:hypothetical protein